MKDLRLELRARNNALWHVIFDTHASVAEFCRTHDFNQGTIGAWLNLSESPYSQVRPVGGGAQEREARLLPSAQRLCDLAGLDARELFPADLYLHHFPRVLAAEVDSYKFTSLAAARHMALPPNQGSFEASEAIGAVLSTLTPREEIVLRRRFGLDGHGESTLEEIASDFSTTGARIRQIEAKALRKLRHPRRSSALRSVAT